MSDNIEELSTEDKKKAINLQDLVYVKKYINDFKEDFETRVKNDAEKAAETTVDNMLADVVSGKITAGNAECVGGYRKRLILSTDETILFNKNNNVSIGTHDISDFTDKQIVVETQILPSVTFDLHVDQYKGIYGANEVGIRKTFIDRMSSTSVSISTLNFIISLSTEDNNIYIKQGSESVQIGLKNDEAVTVNGDKEGRYLQWIKIYVIEPMTE